MRSAPRATRREGRRHRHSMQPSLNETNATLLFQHYYQRQVRYRGAVSPPWQTFAGLSSPKVRLADGTFLTADQIGEAFELMLSPLSGQPKTINEGSVWHGVDSLIDPIDAAIFSALLWETQPDLIIEIGTECGGSAVFFASILRMFARNGTVLTYDNMPTWRRCSKENFQRRQWKGYKSPLWVAYQKEGSLVARTADVNSPIELQRIASYARRAQRVLIIDDGDHTTTPILVHFHLLAQFVTPGSYYIIADTRLERTCIAAGRLGYHTPYCGEIKGKIGGPARAVRLLENESIRFQSDFYVDRTAERYVLTQHPGGFLRRRCAGGKNCTFAKIEQPWPRQPSPMVMTHGPRNATAEKLARKAAVGR